MSSITAISTLCGEYSVDHKQMKKYLARVYDDKLVLRKYDALSRNESLVLKHSVIPDFQSTCKNHVLFKDSGKEPSTAERMKIYDEAALRIGLLVSKDAIKKADLRNKDITHIITVSCTGMSAPGLETLIHENLGLAHSVKRYTVNFMGCYAAFHGMRLADMISKSEPLANVLIVCVELCSLHFRKDTSDDNILSTYLFSDGASACIMSNKAAVGKNSLACHNFNSLLIPEGKKDMAWHIGNNGFEMTLTRNIASYIEAHMASAFAESMLQNGIKSHEVNCYAIHPGGKNILKAFERALNLPNDHLTESYEVLRQSGNMSSATILFVLQKFLERPKSVKSEEWLYSAAFGPGLTVESAFFKIKYCNHGK